MNVSVVLVVALVVTVGAPTPPLAGFDGAPRDRPLFGAVTADPPIIESANGKRDVPSLEVRNIRLEPAPAIDGLPSANLRFHLVNEGSTSLTDIVVKVTIVRRRLLRISDARGQVIAGPYTIRGKTVLESGNAMNYEMRLRNLSLDCGCRATVAVVSARALTLSETVR